MGRGFHVRRRFLFLSAAPPFGLGFGRCLFVVSAFGRRCIRVTDILDGCVSFLALTTLALRLPLAAGIVRLRFRVFRFRVLLGCVRLDVRLRLGFGRDLGILFTLPVNTLSAATAAAATPFLRTVIVFGKRRVDTFLRCQFVICGGHERGVGGHYRRTRFNPAKSGLELLDREFRRNKVGIRFKPYGHAVAHFDLVDMFAFRVHQEVDDRNRHPEQNLP